MTTFPAPKPIRRVVSKPLRQSARDKHCTLRLVGCEPGNETVVLAHLRGVWSLGTGIKPSDWFAVFACYSCHKKEESGVGCTDCDRLRALYETWSIWHDCGLLTYKGAP